MNVKSTGHHSVTGRCRVEFVELTDSEEHVANCGNFVCVGC